VLDGRVVVITGDRFGLAARLGALGADVTAVPGPFPSRAAVAATFNEVASAHGPIDVVVHAHIPATALRAESLAEMIEGDWEARGEELLRAALFVVQAAFAQLRERGGRIVLLTPTAGLEGAAGFTPIATATEGMRSLAKSAARQWGARGVTVNCLAPPLSLFGADVADPVNPPALGRGPTGEDLARAIALLAGDDALAITGATIPIDGGVVMLP
jgi:NAD(P)-dependent dehydrogenase (short-subunit alcohol dehydrogenase family)